jgi:predicted ATPase
MIALTLAALRREGVALHTSHLEAILADAHQRAGDAGAALPHLEEALAISARTGEAWFDAELHRRKGGVLFRVNASEQTKAEVEFLQALEIARSQSALLFELRAARDLARLWRDQGRGAESSDLLAPVYDAFSEGFAFPDLVEARALLDELGRSDAESVARPHQDTPGP